MGPALLVSALVFLIGVGFVFTNETLSNESTTKEKPKKPKEPKKRVECYLDKIDYIPSTTYGQYTYLDYSIRELSYPERKPRYYAVVTITGGELGNKKANAIIHFKGNDKTNIWNYSLMPEETCDGEIWTFDEVKRRLNLHFKERDAGTDDAGTYNWRAEYKDYAYYFDSTEEAGFALCQFKKCVDDRVRKMEISMNNNLSENVITVKFES